MKKLFLPACLLLSGLGWTTFAGCDNQTPQNPPAEEAADEHGHDHADHDEHAHDHPSEGPHHGSLIELGAEEYHAELVHDDAAGTVTVYLLNAAAAKPVAIDAEQVTINLTHDGKPEQFQLAAAPAEGDPEGKSSRFVSQDAELLQDLDAHGADARLMVKIDGQSYNASIAHEHDDHGHEDEHEHEHAH